ncbi:MAG: hypothetical protein AUJ12_03260 [Alphaproteobacteria bacterium CG1_02_46_17]|nr:MAG: hypothetical protein AUJ12_03260 [Alphaproteobacteria bacterium CG1_02_46_17]
MAFIIEIEQSKLGVAVENLTYLIQSSDGESFLTVRKENRLALPESTLELSRTFENQAAQNCLLATGVDVDPKAIRLNTCGNDHIILCFATADSQTPPKGSEWVGADEIKDIAPELPENVRKYLDRVSQSRLPEAHYGFDVL